MKNWSKLFAGFNIVMLLSMAVPSLVFAAQHSAGTNIISDGTIYMITDNGQRRPYTSAGAFLSYGFNSWSTVATASTEDLALPVGSFIPPRDGKIVCSDRGDDKGTCYLITNGKRAGFVSAKIFTDLGFSFSKTLTGDVSFLSKDSDIGVSTQQHRSGVLINKNGTIYLVSDSGLLGVPSMDVLATWGYTLGDVVIANPSDATLNQSSVITGRSGAKLSPTEVTPDSSSNLSEDAIVQAYLDTYPDLVTTTPISAPLDGASVIDLVGKIEAVTDTKFESVYPYLSSQSIDLLNKAPNFKSYFEQASVHLAAMNKISSNVQVFQGGTTALYTEIETQTQTNYPNNYYWVAKKENGAWKWDFIGSLKYQKLVYLQTNPTNAAIVGNGSTNLSIVDADYTDSPMVHDPNTLLLVELKNSGQSTVEKFHLVVRINQSVVVDEYDSYELKPGQNVYLVVPIEFYWTLSGVTKDPGQYTTEINASFDNSISDFNSADNVFKFNTNFQQNTSAIKI